MNSPYKIKLSQNSKNKGTASDFSVSYSSKNKDNKEVSYMIISALKGSDGMIIEIDSSLLTLEDSDKRALKSQLMDAFQSMGLTFINQKTSYEKKRTFFSVNIESKKVEGYRIFVYVNEDTWKNKDFVKLLPEYGTRYFILEQFNENDLNTFMETDEEERLEACKMIIFDNISFGSMGINTSKNKEEIGSLLGNILTK